VEYYVNQTFSKFDFRIPHSQFRIQKRLFWYYILIILKMERNSYGYYSH